MTITATSSPLTTAANNIVKIGLRSKQSLPRAQSEFEDFSKFLTRERMSLEQIELPSKKKIKEISNKNIVNNFGSAGNLLSNLLSGAFDLGNFVSGFFPGKGEKIGEQPNESKPQPKPKITGNKLNLGGTRALGILNAVFAGLDFATGISQGESAGKAGAGAAGSLAGGIAGGLAGGALAGAIAGQLAVPIPGLGLVLGATVGGLGSFLGGYVGDRAYEGLTGEAKKEQKEKLDKSSEKIRSNTISNVGYSGGFDVVLDEFSSAVEKFENFAMNIGNFVMGGEVDSYYDEGLGNITAPPESLTPYDGPIDGESFYPLPGGSLTNRSVNIPGGEYGAKRSYGGHSGQDLGGLPGNSPVAAWKTGRLRYIGSVEPGDTIIEIDHGEGYKSVYKHVIPTVADGSIVYGGQQIAKLLPGKEEVRGRIYDTHLHFEVWKNGSHTNPNPYIAKTQKIPRVLSAEKAKGNSEKYSSNGNTATKQEHGVDIYPAQVSPKSSQPPSPNQSQPQPPRTSTLPLPQPPRTSTLPLPQPPRTSTLPLPQQSTRPMARPIAQNVVAAPQKEEPKIQSYPSYSQGQSFILDRQTIISVGNNGASGGKSQQVIPVGGGGGSSPATIINNNGLSTLNTIMKNILLTSLSSS